MTKTYDAKVRLAYGALHTAAQESVRVDADTLALRMQTEQKVRNYASMWLALHVAECAADHAGEDATASVLRAIIKGRYASAKLIDWPNGQEADDEAEAAVSDLRDAIETFIADEGLEQ